MTRDNKTANAGASTRADDDDDTRLKLSMFLPADDDTPSLRTTKYAVLIMGVILIVGFMVVIARIVYLTSRMDSSTNIQPAVTLPIAEGEDVRSMALSDNRLAIQFVGPDAKDRSVAVIDLKTGRIITRIHFAPQPVSAAPTGR
ncbi:MAG: hypothetical protein KDJ37_06380 [Hyphomicrobiaceae bacterium]|nr:hypothetical protein [Hyphomicrobiaceae bacterium]